MSIIKKIEQIRIPAYKQLEKKDPFQAVLWAGIIGNRENVSFEYLHALTIEENLGYQLTRRSMALRELVLDLSFLAWDFDYLSKLYSHYSDLSFANQFAYMRSLIYDIFENWTGGREMPRQICLGGVRKDLRLGDHKSFKLVLEELEKEFQSVFPFAVFEYFLLENLEASSEILPPQLKESYLTWPEVLQAVDVERLAALEKVIPEALYNKLMKNHAETENYDFFVELYYHRLFRILEKIESLKTKLESLPEGDHRILVEHLHIPGNYFVGQSLSAPSGRIYSYYCSGKISYRSLSSMFVEQFERQEAEERTKLSYCSKLFGIDLSQGSLCE
jgi:Ni,Fe-hydrogenase III large subunit